MIPKYKKPHFINPFGTRRGPSNEEIKDAILVHAKKHKQILHGSFAVNAQLPPEYRRPAKDIDVLTHSPEHQARKRMLR